MLPVWDLENTDWTTDGIEGRTSLCVAIGWRMEFGSFNLTGENFSRLLFDAEIISLDFVCFMVFGIESEDVPSLIRVTDFCWFGFSGD